MNDKIMYKDYREVVEFLFSSVTSFQTHGANAYKPGLDNTKILLAHNNNPHMIGIPFIHVAGTNGKGSVTHLIASSLAQANYTVGLYTSPHLIDFRERIKLIKHVHNNIAWETISEEEVLDFMNANLNIITQIKSSFFEITTTMAFAYFAKKKVDIAVIETGLGGRLDSTNIITPVLSVITNIGYDHTNLLGDTLQQIASEKAGIMKPNVPCVIGEYNDETAPVFIAQTEKLKIPYLCFADQEQLQKTVPKSSLQGIYQKKNEKTAYIALKILHDRSIVKMEEKNIKDGFCNVVNNTGLRARWEQLSKQPLIICDIGHNGHAWTYLSQQLTVTLQHQREICPNAKMYVIFGMVNDKDVKNVLSMLPQEGIYYFTQSSSLRSIPACDLKEMFLQERGTEHTNAFAYDNVNECVKAVRQIVQPSDFVFIGGSTYIVSEAINFLVDISKYSSSTKK